MKKIIVIFLSTFLLIETTTVHAVDSWPAAPPASFESKQSTPGVRLGEWLPCRADWGSTNDCIVSIKLFSLDRSQSTNLEFVPMQNFDPQTAKQEWFGGRNMDGTYTGSNARWVNSFPGSWVSKTEFLKNLSLDAEVFLGDSRILVRLHELGNLNMPTSVYSQITLRSKEFHNYAGWVFGNVKDPSVVYDNDLIIIGAEPTASPAPTAECVNLTSGNKEKAPYNESGVALNLGIAGNPSNEKPGDVVVGTNGWFCFQGIQWDPMSQQLVMRVGTSHYDPEGKAVEGWLEAKIKGSRASQWWGMNPKLAATFAKVEVTYEDGTSSVATVKAEYDPVADWISLKAYGFHYSSPAIQVSFKKPDPVASVETVIKGVLPSAPKKSTITCVKGKTIKKIIALKPTCPSGYKKR